MSNTTTLKLQADDFEMALQEMNTVVDITVDDLVQINQLAESFARKRRKETVLIESVMQQSVITVTPDSRLSDAAHLLVANRISGLPVLDEQKKLVGVITEADFLKALGIPAHHTNHSVWQTLENLFNHPLKVTQPTGQVSDLMVTDVITISPQQTLHQALELMKESGVKRLIVCDENRSVAGMVTRSDLVRLFFDHFKAKKNTV